MIASILALLLTIASPKCRECQEKQDDRTLLIFMSFSLPLESWKEYSAIAERAGGTLVLQGIPDNSFLAFSDKMEELRKNGVRAAIDIDPPLFKKYGVEAVPVIVVQDGQESDRIAGHTQVEPFLIECAASGDVQKISQMKLQQLKGPQ